MLISCREKTMESAKHIEGGQFLGETDELLTEAVVPYAVFLAVLSLLFLASGFFNSLFLVIYLRKSSLRNISNKFIASLSLCNLLVSALLGPALVLDLLLTKDFISKTTFGPFMCNLFSAMSDFLITATIYMTVLIAVDRYFAITNPFHCHRLLTKCRCVIIIISAWLMALFIALLSGFSKHRGTWNMCEVTRLTVGSRGMYSSWIFAIINFFMSFLLPFVILSFIYWRIYRAARGNCERTRRTSVSIPAAIESIDPLKNLSRSSSTASVQTPHLVLNIRRKISNASFFLHREESKTAMLAWIIVLLFMTCWMPYYSVQLVASVSQESYLKDTSRFHFAAVWLALLNALASSYIYIYRSKRMVRELRRYCHLWSYESEKHKRRCHYNPPPLVLLQSKAKVPLLHPSTPKIEVLEGEHPRETTPLPLQLVMEDGYSSPLKDVESLPSSSACSSLSLSAHEEDSLPEGFV